MLLALDIARQTTVRVLASRLRVPRDSEKLRFRRYRRTSTELAVISLAKLLQQQTAPI